MHIPGYDIVEEVVRLGSYCVLRGRRDWDRRPVLVKVPVGEVRSPETDALEREHGLLRGLTIPGVPSVYDFVRLERGPCLVLEDRGLSPLARLLVDGGVDLIVFFRIALRLCTILGELHRRDLVYGSLTPRSTLVSAGGQDVQLLDFSLASRSSLDARASSPAGHADPAYIAPEQTGRINRAVDHRADFYAIGVTLYELLTGAPPFRSDDSLELVHAHIARTPVSPATVAGEIPEQISRIVMRLLAKAAEDRYQSALGLHHDLETCEREWTARRAIPLFPLARNDVSERFLIPQRLYGREREVAELMAAFDETCDGRTSMMLVAGYSGIGKTSLISELYRPIVRERGYFLAGKFDQVVRNIPYGALIQAFRGLVWQLLTESEERLAEWRRRLTDTLGANGGVIAEVIPEIELILGKQTPPPPLDPAEARNRFGYVFQAFVGTLAQREHPLVVFLDDLQWVDAATLEVLHALLTTVDIHHLLLIGAYRDNEVDAAHLLTWAVDRLKSSGARVSHLALGPLALPDLTGLLGETLHGDAEYCEPLAQLIQKKTDGNPFFVIQFLKTLQQDGLLAFDRSRARWSFRLDAIAGAGMTDNVIDLMTRKIRRLSDRSQHVLTLAACIGNQFEWDTFLTVSRQPADEAAASLVEAVEAGLIQQADLPAKTADEGTAGRVMYSFLHDRVQQAAYGLIPEAQKKPVHLEVGRLLLADLDPDAPDDRIFTSVNHLNIGSDLVTDRAERRSLVRLNLTAGRKAKTSAAYRAAHEYFEKGIALLDETDWSSVYELAFALHLEAAECQYLHGDFARAESSFALLLGRAAAPLDEAQVHTLRITVYENQSRWADAVASGLAGLSLFGISFPETLVEKEAALDREVEATLEALGTRAISSLLDLPEMSDGNMRTVMRILTILWAPAYISGDELLARLISATMVRLSLLYGNTEDSAYGYVTHAITIGPIRGAYKAAYEWGALALRVNQRFNDLKRSAKIHQQFQAHVNLWCRPFETCIPHAREACRSGLENGDFTYAGYGAATEAWSAFLICRDLERFVRDYSPTLALLDRIRMTDFLAAHRVILNWALALQGRTADRLSLSDGTFDERTFVATYENIAPFFLTFAYTAKLHLSYMFEDYSGAIAAARRAREAAVTGTIWPVLVDFWGSLSVAADWNEVGEVDRDTAWAGLMAVQRSLAELADTCPENFRCFSLLLSAEMCRLEHRHEEATQLCERAVVYARETDNVQMEALGSEILARICLARDDQSASEWMRAAHRCYALWGATAKVGDLETRYTDLLSIPQRATVGADARTVETPVSRTDAASLDMSTVLKVARAIAVEIELDGLLRKLMKIALENAGAERGIFLQERDGALLIEATTEADSDQVRVRQSLPWDQGTDFSHSVVRYVRRTGQPVVVADAGADERFAGDGYIARTQAKSILCVPVGHHGRSAGVLYLENRLTSGAFTPERTEMMRILAAQAAISLENARLYEDMKTEVERRTLAEQSLRDALAELEVLKNRLEAENVYLQEEIRTQHNFNEIVGNHQVLVGALRKVEAVAPTESTVLILGETGAGKELFARAVHSRSRRSSRPLVKVNCGAIAPGLVESELFGHVKGAFTGAIDKRVGRFEVANGGTILLDEIGEMPLEAQVKLLRVLQEHEFEPVGSSRTVRVDVRVIAATNRNLEQAVREGTFRADLLYRLNVFPIRIPPLRDRRADIPLLIGLFVSGLSRRLGKPIQGFSTRSMERLLAYSWPGNVRELQNVVERAAILAQGPVLEVEPEFMAAAPAATEPAPHIRQGESLDDVQRAHIVAVLKMTGGVVEGTKGAATILGLHPNTLRSRMKKLGISTGR